MLIEIVADLHQGCPSPQLLPTSLPDFIPVSSSLPNAVTILESEISPKQTAKPAICECPEISCIASWPDSCICANTAAQNCYQKCGGAPPVLKDCSVTESPISRSDLAAKPEAAERCECDEIMCIQMWPESCYCANAAAESCYQKCGGKKPKLQVCTC